MARLPGEMDGRRLLRVLARFGWTVESQRGSHRKLVKTGVDHHLIVAFHRTIGRAAIRDALRKAGIDEDEFLREL